LPDTVWLPTFLVKLGHIVSKLSDVQAMQVFSDLSSLPHDNAVNKSTAVPRTTEPMT
jgi:hypothetical protein